MGPEVDRQQAGGDGQHGDRRVGERPGLAQHRVRPRHRHADEGHQRQERDRVGDCGNWLWLCLYLVQLVLLNNLFYSCSSFFNLS